MVENGIGASVLRKEDQRFLTGRGNYVDDINRRGQAYAYFVRSPHANANVKSIKTDNAEASAGYVAVFTGADIAAAGLGSLPTGWTVKNKDGSDTIVAPHPPLTETAHFVGDCVAVVIAETLDQAKNAAEKLEIDYQVLPAVVSAVDAANPGAPQVHAEAPNNICFDWEVGDKAAKDEAFSKADHVIKVDLVNNRMVTNAMEPRAAIGEYDAGSDSITLYTTSQNPHVARLVLSAFVQLAPEHKLRVIAPDVGGGFGSKITIYPEETVVAWAAKQVGRPVKWTAERSESFLSDTHGRDHVTHVELALDSDGKFLGLHVSTTANLGAYPALFGVATPTYLYGILMAGPYATPAIYCEVKGVYTHTAHVDASRGAGRPEATYLLERVVDAAAAELGIDPGELRRRNFIPPDAFPYQTPVIHLYDCGDYAASFDDAVKLADVAGLAARKQASEKNGKLRGIGFSAYLEACGVAPSAAAGSLGCAVGLWESAEIRFNPTGNVQLFTGTHSHGQGHETALAQIVVEMLGVPIENVEVVHGDTASVPFGMGTYGSRSLAVGGMAIVKAAEKIIEKGKKIAAHALEAAEGDIEFADGNFTVAGTDKAMNIGAVAFNAYVPHNYPEGVEPGLAENAFYDPPNFSFPAGTHICEVEIDPETGRVEIASYTAVDDFGTIVNPPIVAGQIHGGVTHGIGQALLENCVYDEDSGQLLSGSYMDYAMPRADDLPSYKLGYTKTDPAHNPLGVKGCGEAGAIAAPPAVINAVIDALRPLGVTHIDMPASPERVWRAIQGAAAAE